MKTIVFNFLPNPPPLVQKGVPTYQCSTIFGKSLFLSKVEGRALLSQLAKDFKLEELMLDTTVVVYMGNDPHAYACGLMLWAALGEIVRCVEYQIEVNPGVFMLVSPVDFIGEGLDFKMSFHQANVQNCVETQTQSVQSNKE